MSREVTFRIKRFDETDGAEASWQDFSFEAEESQSVLECLRVVRDTIVGSLAYRFSCRGAVCGSCAMVVNGRIVLACRTLIKSFKRFPVTLEPLPNLPVIKDLVVDMERFWENHRKIVPWIESREPENGKEFLMSPRQHHRIDIFSHCILCMSCYGACSRVRKTPSFLGPAALAKNFQMLADVRNTEVSERLARNDDHDGVWGCDTVYQCCDICPKDIRPTDGIVSTRHRIFLKKLKRLIMPWR